jgi:hypothetical protein
MASVIAFWQLPTEEASFLRYLARSGEVFAIRHMEAVDDPAALRPLPIEELIDRTDAGRLYLTLRSVGLAPLALHRWDPQTPGDAIRYSLPVRFPAIMYNAGTLVENCLSQSDASAYPSEAPAPVAAWMRRVFGWLRRSAPHWHEYRSYRVTELAAQAAIGGLNLVPYHGWQGRATGRSSFLPRPKE